jgi:DNA mismatch endonuclease (patch repair protein)
MADVFSSAERSAIMSRIGGKDTAPELLVRRLLAGLGFRFRLHRSDLPGKPDIVLPKNRKIIFVHGCFWHGHGKCARAALPSSNVTFWKNKISGNRARDYRIKRKLRRMGWSVLEVWQCQISDITRLTERLINFLEKKNPPI